MARNAALRARAIAALGFGPGAVLARNAQLVYGALHGIQGVLNEDLIDLGRESAETLEMVAATPSAALRSVRKKPTLAECEQALRVFQAHDARPV